MLLSFGRWFGQTAHAAFFTDIERLAHRAFPRFARAAFGAEIACVMCRTFKTYPTFIAIQLFKFTKSSRKSSDLWIL